MADPMSDRAAGWLTMIALVTAAASSAGIILLSTRGLRWAHLYRQQFVEGIGFVGVGLGLVAATVGAVFSGTVLLWAIGRTASPLRRLVYLGIVIALATLVVGAAIFAFYVASLGNRCFGSCG